MIHEQWAGQLVIKGLLTPADAEQAVGVGADAIVVSNHGGRQLDSADATLRVLPEIVATVAGRCDVLVDGGIRSGIDIIKAIALGARAVLVGRPWLYGLACDKDAGVARVLEILRDGLTRNMTLMGVGAVGNLDQSVVRAPDAWFCPMQDDGEAVGRCGSA